MEKKKREDVGYRLVGLAGCSVVGKNEVVYIFVRGDWPPIELCEHFMFGDPIVGRCAMTGGICTRISEPLGPVANLYKNN